MVLIINGESYGWLHKLFFFSSGVCTSLFWASFNSNPGSPGDLVYKRIFKATQWNNLAFILVPMFLGFFFFNSARSLFSFTTTLRLHILLLIALSTGFYSLCVFGDDLKNKLLAYVLVIAQLSLTIQLTVVPAHQISNMRFLMHFTHVEIAYFLSGHFLPFGSFAALNLLRHDYFSESASENFGLKFCFLLNSAVYLCIFAVNSKYISHYINRNDDLVGQNETIRIIIKEKETNSTYTQYFELFSKHLLPVVLVFLNPSLNALCKILYFNTNPLNSKNEEKMNLVISIVANTSCVLGVLLHLLIPNAQILLVSFLTLVRLGLLGFLAVDSNFPTGFLTSPSNWVTSMALFWLFFGYNQASTFTIAAQRTEDKYKNNTGYLLTLSMMLGIVYGEALSSLVMRNVASS